MYLLGCMQCENGWYGVDCSIPSVRSAVDDWPQWLCPSQVSIPDNGSVGGNIVGFKAVVEKKRPLIYVYDLPPEFNSILLEVRRLSLSNKRVIFVFSVHFFVFNLKFSTCWIAGSSFQVRVHK